LLESAASGELTEARREIPELRSMNALRVWLLAQRRRRVDAARLAG